MKNFLFLSFFFLVITSCELPERECTQFHNGTFSFTTTGNGKEVTTKFEREGDLEIDYYQNKIDSSSVRWINDCEYIVKKLKPIDNSQNKSIHMKILSTTATSYEFEYSMVGESKKSRGTAIKTN